MTGVSEGSVSAASAIASLDDAKRQVLADKGRLWKDPGSIQSAQISQVHACSGGIVNPGANVCVCVDVNAKNGFGGYTGIRRSRVLFEGTKLLDINPLEGAGNGYSCGQMMPFPELDGNYVAAVAQTRR